jgi:maltooligosyltrehalose trehalohydrolase
VRELLALRREWLVPRLSPAAGGGSYRFDGGLVHVDWPLANGATWHLAANLATSAVAGLAAPEGRVIYSRHLAPAHEWRPGAVVVALEEGSHG